MTNNIIKTYIADISEIESSKDLPEYYWVGNTIDGSIPVLLPFKNSKGFIYDIGLNVQNISKIHQAIEFLALKTLLSVNNNFLKVTVIDIGFGATLQNLKKLNKNNVPIQFITEQQQLEKFLVIATNTSKEIDDNILSQRGLTHISEFNLFSEVSKPYNLILIPNFPKGLNNQQIDKIKDLMLYAGKCGFIFILGFSHSEVSKVNEKSYNAYDFNFFTKNMHRINIVSENENALYNVHPQIIELIRNRGYNHLQITENKINDAINLVNSKFSKTEFVHLNKDFLSIPIGFDDNGNRHFFNLGSSSKAYHVLISGVTGSGKSTLLNNILTQIAENYSSDDVRLFLFDYKQAVEFNKFRNHPNVELLHLDNNNYDIAIETLKQFINEITVRSDLFVRSNVDNIEDYIEKYKIKLDRKILIIDEIQRIFKTDYSKAKEIKELLEQVAQQGRSYGLHLIICSQTFRSIDKISDFRGQFNVRIGFRHEETLDANSLGIDKDFINLPYYQIYHRTPLGINYVPHLDDIKKSEIESRINACIGKHTINNKFKIKIVEPNSLNKNQETSNSSNLGMKSSSKNRPLPQ